MATIPTDNQRIGALLIWLADTLQSDPPPAVVLITADHLAAIDTALRELFTLRKQLAKRGRPSLNGEPQTGTERSKRSREARAAIEAPLRAQIAGLKAELRALRKVSGRRGE